MKITTTLLPLLLITACGGPEELSETADALKIGGIALSTIPSSGTITFGTVPNGGNGYVTRRLDDGPWIYATGYPLVRSAPAAASWIGETSVFYVDRYGVDAHLRRYSYTTNTDEDWGVPFGYAFTGRACGAASWGVGRFDVLCPATYTSGYGDPNATVFMLHISWASGALGAWQRWGAPPAGVGVSGVALASMAPGRLDGFVLSSDGHVYRVTSDGSDAFSWSDWGTSPARLAGDPAAASWGSGRLDVFFRDSSGYVMWQHAWDTNGDMGWWAWPGLPNSRHLSSPAVTAFNTQRYVIVATDDDPAETDGSEWRIMWDRGQGAWQRIGPGCPGCGRGATLAVTGY